MGKETREMLRTIISGQELIMAHLKIKKPGDKPAKKETNNTATKPAIKAPAKKVKRS